MAASISFPKWVTGVDLSDVVSGTDRKLRPIRILRQVALTCQLGEQSFHLEIDKLWIAKPIFTLGSAYLTWLASPIVDILKKVMMNPFVVVVVKFSIRKRLFRSCQKHQLLELIQVVLISWVGLVFQNVSSRVTQRIFSSVVAAH